MLAIRPEDERGPRDALPAIATRKETDTMATQTQNATGTAQVPTKSGKGNVSGVVSELTTFWTVTPGHEDGLRAGIHKFMDRVASLPPETNMRTGLRDVRFVIFDGGKRLLFATAFETDWDPYIDDAVLIVGMPYFLEWTQHLDEGKRIQDWVDSAGISKYQPGDPKLQEIQNQAGHIFKQLLQENQVPAEAYSNSLGQYTMPQVAKDARLEAAFQQVLDDAAGAAALQAAPALKPLLDQAVS
jgi:hypothetical protein